MGDFAKRGDVGIFSTPTAQLAAYHDTLTSEPMICSDEFKSLLD